jgi:hypothetical protein
MNGVGNGIEPLDGFRVISPSGKLIGEVAGVLDNAIVVQMRRFGRPIFRPLPRDYALVWEHNRTVVAQLSARELRAAPSLRQDESVDTTNLDAFWRARPPVR